MTFLEADILQMPNNRANIKKKQPIKLPQEKKSCDFTSFQTLSSTQIFLVLFSLHNLRKYSLSNSEGYSKLKWLCRGRISVLVNDLFIQIMCMADLIY